MLLVVFVLFVCTFVCRLLLYELCRGATQRVNRPVRVSFVQRKDANCSILFFLYLFILQFIDCFYILGLADFNLEFVILCYKTYFRLFLFRSANLSELTHKRKNIENPYQAHSLLLSISSYYF